MPNVIISVQSVECVTFKSSSYLAFQQDVHEKDTVLNAWSIRGPGYTKAGKLGSEDRLTER